MEVCTSFGVYKRRRSDFWRCDDVSKINSGSVQHDWWTAAIFRWIVWLFSATGNADVQQLMSLAMAVQMPMDVPSWLRAPVLEKYSRGKLRS
mmetsp:Transcript_36713/g.97807  ORF Transcript_36713/g.97807 Transcript_36713/m.97807 type:complete len:92 (+) Transcript_36713:1643-1918(+)